MFRLFGQRMASIFGSAMILLFFSEYYFINEGSAVMLIDSLSQPLLLLVHLLEFTLYYALFSYIFLLVIERFQVKTIWGLILAGTLFGWATEALIVPVAYEAVPISIIFPSISWHMLVDVLLGWYLLRRLMRLNRVSVSVALFVILGALWAAWATWFWVDDALIAPIVPSDFTGFVLVASLFWIAGMVLVDTFGTATFEASKWEIGIILLISLAFFVLMALPFLPFSLVLPPLILLTLFALHRGKSKPVALDRLAVLHDERPRWWQYCLALLTPLSAALIYPLFYDNQVGIPSEDVIFLLLLAGFVMYVAALVQVFRGNSKSGRKSDG